MEDVDKMANVCAYPIRFFSLSSSWCKKIAFHLPTVLLQIKNQNIMPIVRDKPNIEKKGADICGHFARLIRFLKV